MNDDDELRIFRGVAVALLLSAPVWALFIWLM